MFWEVEKLQTKNLEDLFSMNGQGDDNNQGEYFPTWIKVLGIAVIIFAVGMIFLPMFYR